MKREAIAMVARSTGHRYQALEKAIDDMPVEARQDLIRMIDNLKSETRREQRLRRTGQFWR